MAVIFEVQFPIWYCSKYSLAEPLFLIMQFSISVHLQKDGLDTNMTVTGYFHKFSGTYIASY
jgi:hypothetical protein